MFKVAPGYCESLVSYFSSNEGYFQSIGGPLKSILGYFFGMLANVIPLDLE